MKHSPDPFQLRSSQVSRDKRAVKRRNPQQQYLRLAGGVGVLLLMLIAVLLTSCDNNSDKDNSELVPAGNIESIAGIGGEFAYDGDGGAALDAHLGYVTGVALDRAGNVYVVDGAANLVRRINHADGKISTIAGTFLGFNVGDPTPHAGDGGAATTAHLNVPFGVAVGANNDVYIADAGNHVVRRIDAVTGTISVFAGNYSQPLGYTGDGGPAINAALYTPYDVAIDQSGNVFIADKDNHAIRRVAVGTGIISTVAGGGPARKGYSGDQGPATSARLNTPQGIAVAANGDLYIADAGNHVIRRVEAGSGNISTVAGTGTSGYSGDNGPATAAKLSGPTRISLDPVGNLYIADHGNHVIRRVEHSGTITSIAGDGLPGFSGDGGPAIAAQLSSPFGIAGDDEGNLVITDNGNSAVRAVARSGN